MLCVMKFIITLFLLTLKCTYPSAAAEIADRINSNAIAQVLAQDAISKKALQRDAQAQAIKESAKELAFAGEIAKDD